MENDTAEFRDYEATRTFVVGVVVEVGNLAGSGESGPVNSDYNHIANSCMSAHDLNKVRWFLFYCSKLIVIWLQTY